MDEYFSETCGCVIRDGRTFPDECDKHGFLAEVKRRAGASIEEMQQDAMIVRRAFWCGNCDGDAAIICARRLSHILGEEDTP